MRKKSILFIMIVLVIGTGSLPAQEYKYSWIDFGFGSGKIHIWRRSAFFFKATYQKGHATYSLRYTQLFRPFSEAKYDNASDLGVLYGRTLMPPRSRFQVSGGVGIALTGVKVKWEKVSTIGIPIEAQISYRFSRSFGIGFYGYMNINPRQNFNGVGLIFQIGKNLNKG